ncbi:hypothetical protein A2210_02865 [Candidatus Woesebacteria bacterium RIFOXYA1_FULL_40_18]|uniref:Uncharacterized protein n=3 Tax=Candidatus Woeseibacteriota TaxID=1752722 RepID=A0A1F8CJU9_9BACT|nr:MAG: hypothetical protein A2210_02865 [Candidatus Woesebacteria bacterium RIFOXYA1_FULL_40_18]OGM80302.1 MAG: hypothetical protein A2361_01730 [Candidatus Woesebacteria bacterium RIFOXYB1_FULL_40_26]OGM87167.1 MAG: hypothetical protein A2614_01850 [Candidatus Woesebacteria bacterium RIFOXYD1_FULL_40_21]
MTEDDKHILLDNIVKVELFPKSIEDLLNQKLQYKPTGTETVIKPSSKKSTGGYTAEIDDSHPGAPPINVTAETRKELDEKIKKAGLQKRTMTITKDQSPQE